MLNSDPSVTTSIGRLWSGRIISAVVGVAFLADAVAHVVKPIPVVQAFEQLGVPPKFSFGLGILQICVLLLYALPTTSLLGAVLLTGYLGGAIAINLRAQQSPFTLVFALVVGVAFWVGLLLRYKPLTLQLLWRR